MIETVSRNWGKYMAQMYGNDIGKINIEKMNNAYANSYSETRAVDSSVYTKPVEASLGYKYNKDDITSKVKHAISEGFEDYVKSLQEREKEEAIDREAKEKEQKENERELAGNLTHQELQKLSMMGIDVESASLSDVMGIVTTMRGEAHREEVKTLMAEITMSDDISDSAMISGGKVVSSVSGVELSDIDVTDFVISEDASKEQMEFTRDDFIYLVKNNLDVNKENLYKAHYSGSKASDSLEKNIYDSIKPQLERVISQAGYEVDSKSLFGAEFILANELPLNTDNIRKYMEMEPFFGKELGEAEVLGEAVDEKALADRLYRDVRSISNETVYEMTLKGMDVTIAAVRNYSSKNPYIQQYDKNNVSLLQNPSEVNSKPDNRELELKAISNLRSLEELRLSMTIEAAGKMIKQDINIDTRELSLVVARLKATEKSLMEESLRRNGLEPTEENIDLVNEVKNRIGNLEAAPAAIIAAPLMGSKFTVNALNETFGEIPVGKEKVQDRDFEAVKRSYEAVGTKVRADLGDSITKAFSNVDDILRELSLDVNYENRRAVRILSYNRLELTNENIDEIVNYDRQVNTLIDSFYPEAVMGIIKDGINPLDMPIEELNRVIAERNYNQGVTEAYNFATYLRDIERLGEITPEERESYIGIYRIMDKLSKSGDREAGFVFGSGSRLNLRNLIAAAKSRRATGIDATIDDSFGLISEINVKGKKIDAQIESAFSGSEGEDIFLSDNFAEGLLALDNEAVEALMADKQIEPTMINAKAVFCMLNEAGGIYDLVSDLMTKMKFKTSVKEEAVDEETENMSKSLTGYDIENSISMESILESIESEKISYTYEDLRNQLTEFMYDCATIGNINSRDISTIKTIMAGFNIMNNMAKNDYYQIPFETENGVSLMHLTIIHDVDKKGTINISVDTSTKGGLTADLRLMKNRVIEGAVVAATSEENTLLMENTATLINMFANLGYDAKGVTFGSRGNGASAADVSEGKELYQAAVAASRAMTTIAGKTLRKI